MPFDPLPPFESGHDGLGRANVRSPGRQVDQGRRLKVRFGDATTIGRPAKLGGRCGRRSPAEIGRGRAGSFATGG